MPVPTGQQRRLKVLDPIMLAPELMTGRMLDFASENINGLVDGDPISTWFDKSGNGKDATGITTARPTYKTNILNGFPVVRFNGTSNVLTTASYNMGTGLGGFTEYCVIKSSAVLSGYKNIFDNGSEAPALYTNGTKLNGYFGGDKNSALSLVINTWYTFIITRFPSGSYTYHINGVQDTAINSVISSVSATAWRIGSAAAGIQWYDSDMARIIFFNGAHPTNIRQAIERYLRVRYAHY